MRKATHWHQLSPAKRGAVVTLAVIDAALRTWSLVDLVKRPQEQVKGPKAGWAIALSVINSAGLVPAAYLGWARRAG